VSTLYAFRCGVCGELYDPGPKHHECSKCRREGFVDDCTDGWDSWDDGEFAFYRHCRESKRHQATVLIDHQTITTLLERLPATISDGRAHQKLMRNPALAPLRRIFR
jgi:hypothetical protein